MKVKESFDFETTNLTSFFGGYQCGVAKTGNRDPEGYSGLQHNTKGIPLTQGNIMRPNRITRVHGGNLLRGYSCIKNKREFF